MPTYEYVCTECEHRFEKFQSFSANALRTCPECKKKALQKVLFPVGIGFKGSGFYVNDSRSSGQSSTTSSDSSSSGSGSGSKKSDGSSDTKKKSDSSDSTKTSGSDNTKDSKTASTAD